MRDAELEDAFARREAAAYDAAYRRFGPRMQATALRLLRDRELAGECVHDVFLHLWHRENAYVAARGSLEAFLVTAARNRAISQLRDGTRHRLATVKIDAVDSYVLDDDPIERDRIGRAVSRLSDGQNAVVKLAYFRAMTLNEVADELAIPIGTVKGRLSSALRALRRSLIPETTDGS